MYKVSLKFNFIHKIPVRVTTSVNSPVALRQLKMDSGVILQDFHYGKDSIKLLYLNRQGNWHSIKEIEVSTALKLDTIEDYETADNSKIIATDTQKNTVYILAKKYGVTTIEKFGQLLCNHFITKYSHVVSASAFIKEYPWKRIQTRNGEEHNHAFRYEPNINRWTKVSYERGSEPTITCGLDSIRVLKTTQSSFENFVDDEYRSLPDMKDRFFSTSAQTTWRYSPQFKAIPFDKVAKTVERLLLEGFAGEKVTGVPSPSVQNTMYLIGQQVLATVPEIQEIEIRMPNIHYNYFDFSKFSSLVQEPNDAVLVPTDKPFGNIYAKLARPNLNSKL